MEMTWVKRWKRNGFHILDRFQAKKLQKNNSYSPYFSLLKVSFRIITHSTITKKKNLLNSHTLGKIVVCLDDTNSINSHGKGVNEEFF